jgi:ABC-type bacteriocin/lantibiotic exporter with double-glycine peptidase domain
MTAPELIHHTLRTILIRYGFPPEDYLLREKEVVFTGEQLDTPERFLSCLVDIGARHELVLLRDTLPENEFLSEFTKAYYPALVITTIDGRIIPVVLTNVKNGIIATLIRPEGSEELEFKSFADIPGNVHSEMRDGSRSIIIQTVYPNKPVFSEYDQNNQAVHNPANHWDLMSRFLRLIRYERHEVGYIIVYAVIVGLIGLTLPLGVQSIIGFVSGGQIPTAVIVLITFIVLGLLIGGSLQIMQLYLSEHIQRRLFTKTAFEFAFRIPRIRIESVLSDYPPELVNRFFDVVTLQKGIATLLLEFSGAVLQIIFGLLLLALYHPTFIILGAVVVTALVLILRLTGPKGLQNSIEESKHKYAVASWLEELARGLTSFKLAGETNLAMERTDRNVSHYLYARSKHFKVLVTQYISFVLFRTIITGGLLIAGCILVVNRQINIGQFVAAEIVVILIMSSVEKIILKLDTIYDVLTSVDKISHVTDLPVDHQGLIRMPEPDNKHGMVVRVHDLTYKFPDRALPVLNGVDMHIQSGEHVCIAGHNGSGKTSLVNILLGLLGSWKGVVTFDGLALRDIDRESLLSQIGDYVSQEELFDASLLENITMNRKVVTLQDVIAALDTAGLKNWVQTLPDGLSTRLVGGSQRVPASVVRKIILARSICCNPRLLLLDDFLLGVERAEKERVINILLNQSQKWTVIFISNDPLIMQLCNRVLLLKEGRVVANAPFKNLAGNSDMSELLNNSLYS